MARLSLFFSLLLTANLLPAQTEFSGDLVDLQKPGAPTKIYFAKDKLRIEPKAGDPRSMGAVIMNFEAQKTTVLMAQQHMYMEVPAQAANQRLGYANTFFRTGDVESACSEWQKTTHVQGGTCHKMGNETVNGRSTVKYEGSNSNGEISHFWIDPKLRFPVKWESKNGGWELRNIQEGSQPSGLFEIPAGYTKFDMPGMMQQPH
jgi:hypothetical protein